jgi:hypothetical protein
MHTYRVADWLNAPPIVAQTDSSGQCGVLDCPLRRSARLPLDSQGAVIHTTISGIHWN